MAYEKTTWADGEVITAAALNNMEQGIAEALPASEVQTSVDAALAQAKASGTFDGKTAYQYAQEGGYTGTEAEFAEKLAEEMPTDSHINELIDTKLGVIENGAY